MKLEAQVVSLDLAKKLKALNVKQESYFTWCINSGKSELLHNHSVALAVRDKLHDFEGNYAAFTVAELGEMLPKRMGPKLSHLVFRAGAESDGMKWMVYYSDSKSQIETANTEADARAKMLEYLIVNKLVKVEELNARI